MSDVFISLGSKVSVSDSAPATYDQAGFAALTFSQILEIASLPPFGSTAQITEHIPLATGIVNKRVGSINYGSQDVQAAYSETDTGLDIIIAQEAKNPGEDRQISVKAESANGDIYYYTAQVSKVQQNFGDANTIRMVDFTLELDNKVIIG